MTPEQNFFRAMPQLSVLENEQVFELAKRTTKRKYRKGEYFFFQGGQVEHLYFLEMGKVEIYKSDINGRKLTLWYIEESEIFCLATVFSLDAFASAEVTENSLIWVQHRRYCWQRGGFHRYCCFQSGVVSERRIPGILLTKFLISSRARL